ncbi:hypothetical protein HNY73_013489 [Argiope bruennichi]|uniref:Uncharacterized protein n=1 Tax=Argiope bruennichi TaxID=94029 RepID=A0A8T0EZ12_ARGBR|nr:hypothetical protein HNY73_013489 [Argiope bruennichi]
MSAQKNESRGRTESSDWPGGGGYLGQREKLVLGWDVSWISISLPPALCVSFRFPPPRRFGRFDGLMALRRRDFAIKQLTPPPPPSKTPIRFSTYPLTGDAGKVATSILQPLCTAGEIGLVVPLCVDTLAG